MKSCRKNCKKILKLYKEHLKNSIDILNEDHWLEPILRINNQTEPTLVALQREEDTVDFDKMIDVVWDILEIPSVRYGIVVLQYGCSS